MVAALLQGGALVECSNALKVCIWVFDLHR